MVKGLLVVVGLLVAVAGVIFTLQGVGLVGGSSMTGSTTWAVAGPVIALVGLAVAGAALRRRPARLGVVLHRGGRLFRHFRGP